MQQAEQDYSVGQLCQVLGVSRSAYYAYKAGDTYQLSPQKQQLAEQVKDTFTTHKRRYGSRRLLVELQEQGVRIGRYQIRSIMQQQELIAIQPKSFVPRTTDSRHGKRLCQNLLLNEPRPVAPNRIWVSDITYLPLVGGAWAYLGTWMDLYSRVIVGWQVEEHMEDSLIIRPLKKALDWRRPAAGLIVHSDRGGQYVSDELKAMIAKHHARQSMSRADDPYDNAFAESFFSRFKAELLEGGAFLSVEDARTEIFDFIEMYYNRIRRHSALGYKSPLDFEAIYYQTNSLNLQQ
jgi:transposase InsO family protein